MWSAPWSSKLDDYMAQIKGATIQFYMVASKAEESLNSLIFPPLVCSWNIICYIKKCSIQKIVHAVSTKYWVNI